MLTSLIHTESMGYSTKMVIAPNKVGEAIKQLGEFGHITVKRIGPVTTLKIEFKNFTDLARINPIVKQLQNS